jgi:hypothetical protein
MFLYSFERMITRRVFHNSNAKDGRMAGKTTVPGTETFGDSPEEYQQWEPVAVGLGQKLEWGAAMSHFVGKFVGMQVVDVEPTESFNGDSTADAYCFTEITSGDAYFTWATYQLRKAVEGGDIEEGDTVSITWTGKTEIDGGKKTVNNFTIRRKPRA